MWCDNFDLDLYNIIPGCREILESAKKISLKTHGNLATDGKLNHPVVWNSYNGSMAFFGFDDPHKPEAYWTDKSVIDCTLEEAIRDCWIHSYVIMLEGGHIILADFANPYNLFVFCYHIRKVKEIDENELKVAQALVLNDIKMAVTQVLAIKEMKRL